MSHDHHQMAPRTRTKQSPSVTTGATEEKEANFYNIGAAFHKEAGIDILLDPDFLEGLGFPVKPKFRYSLFIRHKTSKQNTDFDSLFLCEAPEKKKAE